MIPSEEASNKEKLERVIREEDLSRSSSPNVGPYPVSVRQQLQKFRQMEQPSPSGSTDSERPNTPRRSRVAKIHKKNTRGETPLHILARKDKNVALCLEAIQQEADVNCGDNAGWTPLHEACSHGAFETAKVLLEHGADVNKASQDGETPLHDAVDYNSVRLTWLLLRNGADPKIRNLRNQLPIDLSKTEVISELLMNPVLPEECPKSRSPSRQVTPVVEPVQSVPPVSMPPVHEGNPQVLVLPPPQPAYENMIPVSSLLNISGDLRTNEPRTWDAVREAAVPIQADQTTVQPAELSEESTPPSSGTSPARQPDTSPSASPEHPTDDYQRAAVYDYEADDFKSASKKTPRGVRGKSTRPNSGTATPVTSGKKARGGRGRGRGKGSSRTAELAAETIDNMIADDPYAFRTPDSEIDERTYDRDVSVGPSSKKGRFEGEEIREEDEQDEDEDGSRNTHATKKVPILRISFAAKQPSEDDAEQTPVFPKNKNVGIRNKSKRGGDHDEQRITRSKVRQNARNTGDDEEHWAAKKKRHRMPTDLLPEETHEEYPTTRPDERQVTPKPDNLTDGQKILRMVPQKGIHVFTKMKENKWIEDCKKDMENQKQFPEQFKGLLLDDEKARREAIRLQEGEFDEQVWDRLPRELHGDKKACELHMTQYDERKSLFIAMKIARTRLRLTYEQEYKRMVKRRAGVAPRMSFTRMHREEEIMNPLSIDAPPHQPPLVEEIDYRAKVAKKTQQMLNEHKMDCTSLHSNQCEQWRNYFRKRVIPDLDKKLHEFVPVVAAEKLVLPFLNDL